jgi:dual specificity MAP kinase phosphatase
MAPPSDTATEIIPGVWISGWKPATDPEWLAAHNIRAVFNCTKDIPFHPSVKNQYRIPVDDNLQPAEIRNMELWAPEIALKITREYRAKSPILIHCYAGMQRSTTACAFFMLVETRKPLIEVMRHIKKQRPVAFEPGPNFIDALRGFEGQLKAWT